MASVTPDDGSIMESAIETTRRAFSGPPRDPERIDRIIEKLRAYWHERPDWRLGQMVWNLNRGSYVDSFYVEDDVIEAALEGRQGD